MTMRPARKTFNAELCDSCNATINVGDRYVIDTGQSRGGHKNQTVRRYCRPCTQKQYPLHFSLLGGAS